MKKEVLQNQNPRYCYLNKNKAYRTESTTSCEKSWILDEMDCSVSTKESEEHNLQISLRPHERDSAVI